MKAVLAVLTFAASTLVSPAWAQQPPESDPMARFAPFVGHWEVRHTLWSETGEPPETFEGTADTYFVSNGTVFVVDEVTSDSSYRFVGYHSFDTKTGKYVNWTASSTLALAWSEGEWDNDSEIFQTRRLDPRTGQIDPLVGRGVWTIVDPNTNVFTAIRLHPDGTEVPFKEERYTRLTK